MAEHNRKYGNIEPDVEKDNFKDKAIAQINAACDSLKGSPLITDDILESMRSSATWSISEMD